MACSKDYHQDEIKVGGYEFKLVNEDKDITCSICLSLLREAMGTPCSHLFCKTCLQKWTNEVNIRNAKFHCPNCQQTVNEVYPTPFVDRLVTGADVFCQQKKDDCPWKGSLASYFDKHERECEFKIITCQNEGCVFSCMRKIMLQHVSECEHSIIQCEYCTFETKVVELEKHHLSCEKYPTTCPQDGCDSILPKNEMEEHLNTECEFVIIDCQYSMFGCREKIIRRNILQHNESSMNSHMEIMFKQLINLQQENKKSQNEINSLRQENTNFRNEVKELREESTNFRNEVKGLRKENTNFRNEVKGLRKENTNLRKEIDNRNTITESRLDLQRKEIEKQNADIKELKEQLKDKEKKEIAICSKDTSPTLSDNIEMLLCKGTDKFIRKNDVRNFHLNYNDWYTKIFEMTKENKLYKLNNEMYVKIKNEKRRHVCWYSNSKKFQNEVAARTNVHIHDDLIISYDDVFFYIHTETLSEYNLENKSTLHVLHPKRRHKIIRMMEDYYDEDYYDEDCNDYECIVYNIPNDLYFNYFLILCMTK